MQGQGRRGVYAEDRSIRVLGVEIPSVYLLPRRHEYTRVYTTVYPRVRYCIHACTQVRSKYLLSRARLYVYPLGIIRRIYSDGLRLPGILNDTPEDPKAGVCERDHASALIENLPCSTYCFHICIEDITMPKQDTHIASPLGVSSDQVRKVRKLEPVWLL